MTKLIDYNNNNSDENEEVDKICDLSMEIINERDKTKQRSYTDEEKKIVLALHSLAHSHREIAKKRNIPLSTVQRWVNGHGVDNIDYRDVADHLKDNLGSRLLINACQYEAIAIEKAQDASFKDLNIAKAINIEKYLLLQGQATHRVEHVTKKIDVINVNKNELTDKRRYLEAELTDLQEDG